MNEGNRPKNKQQEASNTIEKRIVKGASCAVCIGTLRALPKKIMPYVLTKQVAAKIPVKAKIAAAKGIKMRNNPLANNEDCKAV